MLILVLVGCLLVSGCKQNPEIEKKWQAINGRDHVPLYHAKIPHEWEQHPPDTSLTDTTKAISTFSITEGQEQIRITIHNFPSESLEERIPPAAQITRWQHQFEKIDPASMSTIPQSFGGFSGLLFEAQGILQGKPTAMLGLSMQLAPEHYRQVPNDQKQRKADYTIKAVGPQNLMNKHKQAILTFAQSFEHIYELP